MDKQEPKTNYDDIIKLKRWQTNFIKIQIQQILRIAIIEKDLECQKDMDEIMERINEPLGLNKR